MKKIILKLTGLKFIAAILGLLYSVLQVRYFGASSLVDGFFIATSAVYMISSLTQGGQLAEVFLPEYLQRKSQYGRDEGDIFFSVIVTRLVVYIFFILVLFYFIAPAIINLMGAGLEEEYKTIAVQLFRLSLGLIICNVISSFISVTLNAERVYGRSEITGIINSFISLSMLLAFHADFGIFVLIYSLLVGSMVELCIGIIFLRRVGIRYRWIWNVENYNLHKFFRIMISTSGYVITTQIYNVVLTAMASYLPSGSLSVFKYVQQMSSKGATLIMGPISTVFFSKIAVIVIEQRKALEKHLIKPIFWIVIIMFSALCGVSFFGLEMLQLLWSKKTLTVDEYNIAYVMFILNFLGLFFSSIGQIFRKTAIAMGGARALYRAWAIVQIFSAVYAAGLIYFFGIYGLASVLFVNMFLMAVVSYVISIRLGIPCNMVLKNVLKGKVGILLTLLSSITIIGVVLIRHYDFTLWEGIIVKSCICIFLIFPTTLVFLRSEFPSFRMTTNS